MADKKISALTALTTIAAGDLLVTVDVSDTTQAASGTTKKITAGELLSAPSPIGSVTPSSGAFTTITATGGSITGITDLAIADGGTGASTAAGARTNLGLGTAATNNTGDFATAVHTHATSDITSGTMAPARLGSGTADATTFLRGDSTWAANPSGTVTSVSVTTAAGVSGSVANATTTPAITVSLGAITPTSVNAVVLSGSSTPTLAVTGTTTVSGANTGDQTNITGNAATVTTNANLTGGVTSIGNAATVITNANLTGGVTSVGNAATVITNANLTGGVTSVGNAATVITNANLTGGVTSVGNAATVITNANLTGGVTSVGNAATVITNANLTGHVTSSGNAAALGSFTSAQLATALSDETGSGASVFAISPVLTTPNLGTPSAVVLTNASGTASININGTVGATTPAAGAFTSVSSTGGANLATSSGNVGISTPSPTYKLTVTDGSSQIAATDGTSIGYINASSAQVQFGATPAIPINFAINATNLATILPSGRVGIGTASPTYKLTVTDGSSQIAATDGTSIGYINASSAQAMFGATPAIPINFAINANTLATILPSGNMGIGTPTPSQKLDVVGTAKVTTLMFGDATTMTTAGAAASHTHAAADIVSGTVATARLGSGTASSGNFLRGDSSWVTISGGGDLLAANNLSDLANATTAKANLAIVPSDVGLGNVSNNLQLTAANNLGDLANATTAKANLAIVPSDVGLGNVSNNLQLTAANNLGDLANATTAKTNLAIVPSDVGLGNVTNNLQLAAANNLGDLANATTAKTNLAIVPSDVGLGNVTNNLQLTAANNLGDLTNSTTARTNLSLGTMATQNASAVAVTGGTINGATVGATTTSTGAFTSLSSTIGSSLATSSGSVGVGTASPTTKLYVSGNSASNISALTDGATITPDFSAANNFSVTLAGNRTLANPTGLIAGQSGVITITQDATGSRTLAYGSYWDFAGGTAPTLSTAASAQDVLVFFVTSSTRITCQMIANLS